MFADAQTLLDAMDGVAYLLDLDERIVAYGRPGWERFARANAAPELLDPASVIGRALGEFVQGEEVRQAYRRIMRELGAGATEGVALPFRCDGPAVRRELRMAVTPVRRDGSLVGYLYASTALAEDERPPIDLYDFKAMARAWEEYKRRPLVRVCSFCLRVRRPDGPAEWLEAEDYYRAGGSSAVSLSHGVCAPCAERLAPASQGRGRDDLAGASASARASSPRLAEQGESRRQRQAERACRGVEPERLPPAQ